MSRRICGRGRRIRAPSIVSQGPLPTFSMRSPSLALGPLTTWGPATAPGTPPVVITDSVTGVRCVRFDTGVTMSIPSGMLDFLSQGTVTTVLVWRARKAAIAGKSILFDTSGNGTTNGYQIRTTGLPADPVRQCYPRISNGSTWVVDYTLGSPYNAYEDLLWNITVSTTSSTRLMSQNLNAPWADIAVTATLPVGAAGAAILGGTKIDVIAFDAFQGGLADALIFDYVRHLAASFNIDAVFPLWGDGATYYADAGGCRLPNGKLMALCYHSTSGATNDGDILTAVSGDEGKSWTYQTALAHINPTLGYFDPCAGNLVNGDVIVTCNRTDAVLHCGFIRSSDNSATWSGFQQVTHGYTEFEISAAPIYQDAGGTIYMPVYTRSTTDPSNYTSARYYSSTDNGATWPNDVLIADGVADTTRYGEPNIFQITAATAARYVDLPAGSWYSLVRDDNNDTMWEFTAATAAGPFTRHATGMFAFSAARVIQTLDGTILWEGRDGLYSTNTLFRRIALGSWTTTPGAPSIESTGGIGQYGAICAEATAGLLPVITAARTTTAICTTSFRRFPQWQLTSKMPMVITPSAPTLAPLAAQTFVATAAGNETWAYGGGGQNSYGSLSAAGGYVAGLWGSTTDTLVATDLNGSTGTVAVTVSANPNWVPPDPANLLFYFDTTGTGNGAGAITVSGGLVSNVTNLRAVSTDMFAASHKPAWGSATINSVNVLDFSNTSTSFATTTLPGAGATSTVKDCTFCCVIKTGSVVSGNYCLMGNASGPGPIAMSIVGTHLRVHDYGTAGDLVFTDLTVTVNSVHFICFRRTGNTWDAWLDGTKSTLGAAIGTASFMTREFLFACDSSAAQSEQFAGYEAHMLGYSAAKSDSDISTLIYSQLKSIYNTP